MSDWRYERALHNVPMANNGTITERLPSSGIISQLQLYLYGQNSNNMHNIPEERLSRHITNVTIIGDDDDIIVDASAEQLRALAWDNNQHCPIEHNQCYGAKGQWTSVPINFGRFSRDKDYGLDLSKWTEVEVKITNDAAAAEIQADTQSMSARLLWEKSGDVAPTHYMSPVEIDSHVCARANEHYVKRIARKDLIRRIQIQDTVTVDSTSGCPDATRNGNIENIKFSKHTREDIIFDDKLTELGYFNVSEYGSDLETFFKPGNGSMMYPDVCLLDPRNVTEMQMGDAGAAAVAGGLLADDQERYPLVRAYGAGDFSSWQVIGSLPYGCGVFRFYDIQPHNLDGDSPTTWLDPQAEADVEIDYLLGDTDGTVHTVTEAAKPHP